MGRFPFNIFFDSEAGDTFLLCLQLEGDAFGFGDFLSEEVVEADGIGVLFF